MAKCVWLPPHGSGPRRSIRPAPRLPRSQYVPLKETLRGFKMILNGECDELPESAFLFAGTIDDVFAKAKKG